MKMMVLMTVNDDLIWVNPMHVMELYAAEDAGTEIVLSNGNDLVVKGAPIQIAKQLNECMA